MIVKFILGAIKVAAYVSFIAVLSLVVFVQISNWKIQKARAQASMTFNGVPLQSVGAVQGFASARNSTGGSIAPNCVYAPVTSNTSGVWAVTYPSIGSTVVTGNIQAISGSASVSGTYTSQMSILSTTGASGIVVTNTTVSILGINVVIPAVSAVNTQLYLQACGV